MERKNWTLLTISSGSRPLTPAQLQKSVFLAWIKFPGQEGISDYNFKPYNYGPFDKAVYDDAESLASEGLIAMVPDSSHKWQNYMITPEGQFKLNAILGNKYVTEIDFVAKVVDWTQKLTFNQLVSAIYEKFPEMKANSIFQDA